MLTFVAAIDKIIQIGDDCGESYLAMQTPVDSGTVQYKLQNITYSFQTCNSQFHASKLQQLLYMSDVNAYTASVP